MRDQNIIYYAGGFLPHIPGSRTAIKVIDQEQELSLNRIQRNYLFLAIRVTEDPRHEKVLHVYYFLAGL